MERKISVKSVIYYILVIVIIIVGIVVYSIYNFNDYIKGVREEGKTSFTRDSSVKYSDMKSYKIENKEFNDAMFYKSIEVEPNTPYRVTCMVKTENVESQDGKYTGGAQISINETTERSEAISGTNDWTKLTFMFNSNSRTSVEIGFRLGGYDELCKGTAWFSDFTIEEGALDSDNTWNIACFIIENVQTKITGAENLSISYDDIKTIRSDMSRFKSSMQELSDGNILINYDVIEIKEPLTSLTYDETNGYYAGVNDVKPLIDSYVDKNEYDYIYVVLQLGNINEDNNSHDWIGLRCDGI